MRMRHGASKRSALSVTPTPIQVRSRWVKIDACLRGSQIATYRSIAIANKMPDSMHWNVWITHICKAGRQQSICSEGEARIFQAFWVRCKYWEQCLWLQAFLRRGTWVHGGFSQLWWQLGAENSPKERWCTCHRKESQSRTAPSPSQESQSESSLRAWRWSYWNGACCLRDCGHMASQLDH